MDLIVGYGEIGKAVKDAICPNARVYDISQPNERVVNATIDVMHICFPFSDNFVQYSHHYLDLWKPQHTAIWSTLPIGTTKLVSNKAIHTPVEGKHPQLANSIQTMTRWVGYNDQEEGKFFTEYFQSKQLKVHQVVNSDCTEALKLLS